MILLFAALAAAASAASPDALPATPWAQMTVAGLGLNPVEESWRFGLSGGRELFVVRSRSSRISQDTSLSLTRSSACPGLIAQVARLAEVRRTPRTGPPPPTDGLDYRLDVISPRPVAGVRGPLHLTGDDVSPLAVWTKGLIRIVDRCSGHGRRARVRRPSGPPP